MTRNCPTCGKELVRKRFSNGDIEPNRSFIARKHCGTACRSDKWKRGELLVLSVILPYFPSELVAIGLGRTRAAVMQKATELGVRRTARGRSNAWRFGQAKRRAREHACN